MDIFVLGVLYFTLDALKEAIKASGIEDVNVIVAIDFTQSNVNNGAASFGGKSLHHLGMDASDRNPYQQALESCIVSLMDSMDEDRRIPVLAFGDQESKTTGLGIRYLAHEAYGFMGVLDAYNAAASNAILSGPTSFGPILREAMHIVRQKQGTYHILLILCDGQITDWKATKKALLQACDYPLSIIVIGVGDGPWQDMEGLDDDQDGARPWDNVQFVRHSSAMSGDEFARRALQEIPDQFRIIRERGLLGLKK